MSNQESAIQEHEAVVEAVAGIRQGAAAIGSTTLDGHIDFESKARPNVDRVWRTRPAEAGEQQNALDPVAA